MRKLALLFGLLFFNIDVASAYLVDTANDSFVDTRTGYEWADLDLVFGTYYGFAVEKKNNLATRNQVQSLEYSIYNHPFEVNPLTFYQNPNKYYHDSEGGRIVSFYRDDSVLGGVALVSGSVHPGDFPNGWEYGFVPEIEPGVPDYSFGHDGVGFMEIVSYYPPDGPRVPEPLTMLSLLSGLVPLGYRRWRQSIDAEPV